MSKDFFNSRAATWDECSTEKNASRLEAMAERLDIRPGDSVLDVGSGTGVFVPYLLKKIGAGGSLVCLDFAGEMLKIAKSKGFRGNISYLCADIVDSSLPGDSFDIVVCYSVFPHFIDKPRALKEIHRLLKKNGRLFICHTSGRRLINEIHRSIPEVCDHLCPENDDMRRMLIETGFNDVSIDDGMEDYLARARKIA